MVQNNDSKANSPYHVALSRDFVANLDYIPPEIKTISAARIPKKRIEHSAKKENSANETKPFSVDDLFMTDC